jgi:hypothetical protein
MFKGFFSALEGSSNIENQGKYYGDTQQGEIHIEIQVKMNRKVCNNYRNNCHPEGF